MAASGGPPAAPRFDPSCNTPLYCANSRRGAKPTAPSAPAWAPAAGASPTRGRTRRSDAIASRRPRPGSPGCTPCTHASTRRAAGREGATTPCARSNRPWRGAPGTTSSAATATYPWRLRCRGRAFSAPSRAAPGPRRAPAASRCGCGNACPSRPPAARPPPHSRPGWRPSALPKPCCRIPCPRSPRPARSMTPHVVARPASPRTPPAQVCRHLRRAWGARRSAPASAPRAAPQRGLSAPGPQPRWAPAPSAPAAWRRRRAAGRPPQR
mmetsp:Transcript_106139/g.297101  ORF Transcript_106139/g.297101 Transcript_106139/m.297101 type:complete len:268 (-) Transcript_106139:324-1127(-)